MLSGLNLHRAPTDDLFLVNLLDHRGVPGENPISGDKIQPDSFAVRWTGYVSSSLPQPHTFVAEIADADERVKLWIDSSLIIDQWSSLSSLSPSGTYDMCSFAAHGIKLEYSNQRWMPPPHSIQRINTHICLLSSSPCIHAHFITFSSYGFPSFLSQGTKRHHSLMELQRRLRLHSQAPIGPPRARSHMCQLSGLSPHHTSLPCRDKHRPNYSEGVARDSTHGGSFGSVHHSVS